jgi:hypothetical protein
MPDPRLQKRVDDSVCAACRKPILPGHRVNAAYICLDPNARNPERITERGLELGVDNEFVHVRCEDPFLDGGKIIIP